MPDIRSEAAYLESILEHVGVCVAVLEGPELRFALVNPAYQALAPGSQMLGRTYREVFPEAAAAGAEEASRRVLETGEPWVFDSYQSPIPGKPDAAWQGSVVLLAQESAGERSILVTARDVTAHKQRDEALEASETRYRRLFEAARDGILILDAETGAVMDVNPFLEGLLGYSHHELVGRLIWELGPFKDVVANHSKFQELQEKGYVRYEDLPLERADGGLAHIEFVSNVYDSDHQNVIQCNIRDISERKRADEALEQAAERLRQAQKMEAVGQLAGGIAHDFNNLLTAILGYSEMILARESGSLDELRPEIEEIRHAGQRASALTKQILAFSRRQALRPEVVSLNDVIAGMEPLLRRTIGEDVEVRVLVHPGRTLVEVDPNQFEQVVMNLVVNARDAMSPGGRLTLETVETELDEEYCRTHLDATPGSYVMLSVSDTGVGIDQADLRRIFEPFFTTKALGEGTGMGLATVYGIVKQSRGSVAVRSEKGKGTTLEVYLPRAPRSSDPAPAPAPAVRSVLLTETVVVVEDEPALQVLTGRILGAAGYTTRSFGSAAEALAFIEEGEVPVGLLITDVMLPGALQGHDLAKAVLASRPDLPVLFISGYSRDALVHAGRLAEGVNLLEKPFTPDTLTATVRAVLRQARASSDPGASPRAPG